MLEKLDVRSDISPKNNKQTWLTAQSREDNAMKSRVTSEASIVITY